MLCLNGATRAGWRATKLKYHNVRPLKRYAVRVAEREAVMRRALERFAGACADDPTIEAVYVYGSFADGRIGPESDLDLLVVRNTSLPQHDRADDLIAAAQADVRLDVIVVTPDEFANRLPTTTFGATILRTMRRVDAA